MVGAVSEAWVPGEPSGAAAGASSETADQPTYLPVPDIAEQLGLAVTKVHQLLRDRTLIAVRRDGVLVVPAEFVADGLVIKGLPGTITLLADAGYRDAEIVDWLFARDDSLPGSPIEALRAGRSREVHRRAQASGF